MKYFKDISAHSNRDRFKRPTSSILAMDGNRQINKRFLHL